MKCVNCGQEGPHFVPPSLGEPGFYSCAHQGRYYLALRFKDEPHQYVTLVYYGGMQDEEVGALAAYITDIMSVATAESFEMKFGQADFVRDKSCLYGDKLALPEWVQDLAMMSDNYENWVPFIFVEECGIAARKFTVSHIAIMADGNEFFKWSLGT